MLSAKINRTKKIISPFNANAKKSLIVLFASLLLTGCVSSTIPAGKVKNYDTTIYESVDGSSQSLYDEIGGKDVISKIMTDAVAGFKQDPRLAESFANTSSERLAALLSQQLCELAEGPCTYSGLSMKDSHKGMKITEAQFNALVEVLQIAIRDNGLSFKTENKILALFAPMKPAVIYQ